MFDDAYWATWEFNGIGWVKVRRKNSAPGERKRKRKRNPNAITKHKLYRCWANIKQRCYNPNSPWFHRYGGRGIFMEEEWRNNSRKFISYVERTLGERPPKHSLDRVDNNKGYVRGNLRWSTQPVQLSNREPYKRKS